MLEINVHYKCYITWNLENKTVNILQKHIVNFVFLTMYFAPIALMSA